MSYLVIARKWRPQTFEEVVGQPHVACTLQNAIRLQRIAHAYLFTGARGVGKTSVARILAKALNCERGLSPAPCNECSNCREITAGNSVDVIEIDGASNRGIDSIRELRETVRYRPAKSRTKIYIIDEVHMLTTEAFNALLKTLEEPPEHVLFIFATTEPHKIPSTILSRCQRFDFRRIPTQGLVEHLRRIATTEGATLSDGVLYAVAQEADGSMRDAQSLLEQLLAFSGDGLSDEEVLDVLGVVDRRSIRRVGAAILAGDVHTCLDVVGDLHRRGIDSRRFVQGLCEYLRCLLLLTLGGNEAESLIDLPAEDREALRDAAVASTPESLFLLFQMVMKGEEDIRRSTLPRVALEMLLLRLAQLPRLESLQGILEKLSRIEACLGKEGSPPSIERPLPANWPPRGSSGPKPPAFPRPSPNAAPRRDNAPGFPSTPPPGSGAEGRAGSLEPAGFNGPETRLPLESLPLGDASVLEGGAWLAPDDASRPALEPELRPEKVLEGWAGFLRWLMTKDPILGAKLNGSAVSGGGDGGLQIEVNDLFADKLKDAQSLEQLSKAAETFFGGRFHWTIRSRSAPVVAGSVRTAKSPKTNLRRGVMEHPVVLQALEMLGGELIEIKPPKPDKASKGG